MSFYLEVFNAARVALERLKDDYPLSFKKDMEDLTSAMNYKVVVREDNELDEALKELEDDVSGLKNTLDRIKAARKKFY